MMTNSLKRPQDYLEHLIRLRASNPYAKRQKLRLETKTNRHTDLYGRPWGWYEVFPLGIEVGFWGWAKDDLEDIDIPAWNEEASRIS